MAGTITGAITPVRDINNETKMYVVTLTCTADAAAASFPATVINTLSGVSSYVLTGMYLYRVVAKPGGTPPTDATDLTITDTNGLDLLGGAGTDLIDATSITSCVPRVTISTISVSQPVTGNITANITNNAVNSAVTTLELIFTL